MAMPTFEQLTRLMQDAKRSAELAHDAVAVLNDRLIRAGVFTEDQFSAAVHKRSFRRMLREHPCQLDTSIHEVACRPELLGQFASCFHSNERLPFQTASRSLAAHARALRRGSLLFICGGHRQEVHLCPGEQENLKSAEQFDFEFGRWESLPTMLEQRGGATGALMGKHLYIFGGYNGAQALQSVEAFDLEVRQWSFCPAMSEARIGAACSVIDRCLYVYGGYTTHDARGTLQSAECFDADLCQWRTLPPMVETRGGTASGALGRQIFACGGFNGHVALCSVEVFDIDLNCWLTSLPMHDSRIRAASAVISGQLVVCGGHTTLCSGLTSAEYFNPMSGQWFALPAMMSPRTGAAAVPVAGSVYVCGGFDGQQELSSVESFNLKAGEWRRSSPPMAECRNGAAGVGITGRNHTLMLG